MEWAKVTPYVILALSAILNLAIYKNKRLENKVDKEVFDEFKRECEGKFKESEKTQKELLKEIKDELKSFVSETKKDLSQIIDLKIAPLYEILKNKK